MSGFAAQETKCQSRCHQAQGGGGSCQAGLRDSTYAESEVHFVTPGSSRPRLQALCWGVEEPGGKQEEQAVMDLSSGRREVLEVASSRGGSFEATNENISVTGAGRGYFCRSGRRWKRLRV